MGLTWKDGISTLFMGAIAVIYLTLPAGLPMPGTPAQPARRRAAGEVVARHQET
jgi:hypothetical protein